MKLRVSNIVFGFGTVRFRGCFRSGVVDANDSSFWFSGGGVIVVVFVGAFAGRVSPSTNESTIVIDAASTVLLSLSDELLLL